MDASTPAWQQLDATFAAHNGDVYRTDLLTQVNADAPFLASLRAITFPPEAAPAAADLIAAIEAYDTFLMAGYDNFDTYVRGLDEAGRLGDARAQSSRRLRDALGLPASTATYRRP